MLLVKNLSARYGISQGRSVVIRDVNFEIHSGQILGLLGVNGAGKSTLIKCLLGEKNYTGEILFNDLNPIKDRTKLMMNVACISDSSILPHWMKVQELLNYVDGVHPKFSLICAYELLKNTNIQLQAKIKALSNGMKMQLQMILIIALDVSFMILDEPTLGLDLVYQDYFYQLLQNWMNQGNRACIIASHEINDIEHLLTDIIILRNGRFLLQSSLNTLKKDYFMLEIETKKEIDIQIFRPLLVLKTLDGIKYILKSLFYEQVMHLGVINEVNVKDIFLAIEQEQKKCG